MTDLERGRRIAEVCEAALAREPAERAAFIAGACGPDAVLRQEVEAVLAHQSQADRFLATPIGRVAAQILGGSPPALVDGSTVGPYTIVSLLGVGGMGEVYRARDTKLHREVALKVLPAALAADGDRLARLAREARTLATLNHPHIAQIYGLEESGGATALVLELVDGPTLADRLKEGPLALDEALAIARQIADALEAAHNHGIVHRDLKPANITVRPDGTVKVLDFGLAKAMAPPGSPPPLADSPTIITPAMTHAGVILGTAAYMSPEQARGKPVDKRTDVWAFGCVLYEMLTGRRAFDGEEAVDVLAAVTRLEPDWAALPANVPPPIVALLRACLRKDSRARVGDLAAVRFVLDEGAALAPVQNAPATSQWRPRAIETVAALTLIAAGIGVGLLAAGFFAPSAVAPGSVVQLSIEAPADTIFADNRFGSGPAISPDGRMVALVAGRQNEPTTLWIRDLASEEARQVPGTMRASWPFWSMDGRAIGYFDGSTLMRVDRSGRAPQRVAEVPGSFGGSWNERGAILVGSTTGGIRHVQPGDGTVRDITRPDPDGPDSAHRHPKFLPDGHHFLFYGFPSQSVYVGTLGGDSPRRLDVVTDSFVTYVSSGHLVFVRSAVLFAQPFDVRELRTTGDAFAIGSGVRPIDVETSGRMSLSISDTGTLMQFVTPRALRQLSWRDRRGAPIGEVGESARYVQMALSPDAARVAAEIDEQALDNADIWVIDAARGLSSRITSGREFDGGPIWAPDGLRVMFQRQAQGKVQIVERTLAARTETVAHETSETVRPEAWSHDGQFVLLSTAGSSGLLLMRVGDDAAPELFVNTAASEEQPEFSPDDAWVAFNSSESGRSEVYLQPFQRTGERIRVSDRGGMQPHWRADGRELFYLTPAGEVIAVALTGAGGSLRIGRSDRLFALPFIPSTFINQYAVTGDGQRFLILAPAGGASDERGRIIVTTNWAASLAEVSPR